MGRLGTLFGANYDRHHAAFVDLHIEQGPILETAPDSLRILVEGEGGMPEVC